MEKNEKTQSEITSEEQLPDGKIISYFGDDLAISEKARKEVLIWELDGGNTKSVWILSLRSGYLQNNFMQAIKTAEAKGYKITKKGLIEPNLLNFMYDRRMSNENKRATGDDSIVVNLFEMILKDALDENVSDIHVEVRTGTTTVIKMRKNGEMMEYRPNKRLNYEEGNNLCSVIYNVLASTKDVSFDPKECQQAELKHTIDDRTLKLRYQSVPAYPEGYDIILRVLPIGKSEDFTPLQKLGYTEQQVQELVNIASRPIGALIIAGVTGSGKSTTLKNLLMFINVHTGYKLKIYTIEDPPEYNIAKVTQIPVVIPKGFDPTKHESPFAKPIKACMRGDPDIIMIGEVRDKITGDLTKKAIQSGHQVLTTVHATSALGIIDRFQDFGLTRSVLGSPEFLSGLLYQKLLPLLCEHCAIDFEEHLNSDKATQKDAELQNRINKITKNAGGYKLKLRSDTGCTHCNGSGIKGRTVVAEVIMLDLQMAQYIEKNETIPLMMYWRGLSDKKPDSENMRGKTCMEHGFQKVLRGLVSPVDLEASFKPIDEMLLDANINKNKFIKSSSEKPDVNDDGWENL